MPMSCAARWLSAVARKARPVRVRLRKNCRPNRTRTETISVMSGNQPMTTWSLILMNVVLDAARVEPLAVGREALEQQVLDDDGDAERREDGLHRAGVHGEVEEPPLDEVAEEGHDDHDQDERVERVDLERTDDDESDVGGHDAEVAVSQVDQAHDAEHQREAGGEQRVETRPAGCLG